MAVRRPRPNRRRGLLRAIAVAIVLIALAVVAVLLVSSLTASTAKAPAATPVGIPTAPATPGPIVTPTVATTPRARPSATGTQQRGLSSRIRPKRLHRPILERRPTMPMRSILRSSDSPAARAGSWIASFRGISGSGPTATLVVRNTVKGTVRRVGLANPYVRPVWSPGGTELLYVSSTATATFPGVRWTVYRYDLASARAAPIARVEALHVTPLGWWRGAPLLASANQAVTRLQRVVGGRVRHVAIMMPQILTSALLSPDGTRVAFVAPTNCITTCTLDVFDLATLEVWVGPTGVANPTTFTWTTDGRALVSLLNGTLARTDVATKRTTAYRVPDGLPGRWADLMRARDTGAGIRLIDSVSGRVYASGAAVNR